MVTSTIAVCLYADIQCPILSRPRNGMVFYPDRRVNSVADYYCLVGFVPELKRRTCLENGQWSGFDAPSCISKEIIEPRMFSWSFPFYIRSLSLAVRFALSLPLYYTGTKCERNDLSDPLNGVVTVDSVTVGSIANYTCDQAYTLVGQPTRICVRNGADTMWSGQAPTCQCKQNMHVAS